VEDIQRGPESCLPDFLRTVGLQDVAVEVDPLPRTVQAWGRAPRPRRRVSAQRAGG